MGEGDCSLIASDNRSISSSFLPVVERPRLANWARRSITLSLDSSEIESLFIGIGVGGCKGCP